MAAMAWLQTFSPQRRSQMPPQPNHAAAHFHLALQCALTMLPHTELCNGHEKNSSVDLSGLRQRLRPEI
jgi:hypothetical protein